MTDNAQNEISSLYKLHKEPVLRFIRGRLHNREKAEELTQDVFIKLLQLMKDTEVRKPRAMLFTIANNLVTDTYRGEQVRRNTISEWDSDETDITSNQRSMESRLDDQRALDWLMEAILELPDRCREAFILRKIEGFSYKEIALEMNLSVKTVEKHLAHGLVECKRYLHAKENNVYSIEAVRRKRNIR